MTGSDQGDKDDKAERRRQMIDRVAAGLGLPRGFLDDGSWNHWTKEDIPPPWDWFIKPDPSVPPESPQDDR